MKKGESGLSQQCGGPLGILSARSPLPQKRTLSVKKALHSR